jgi:uncharacterized protein
VIAAELLQLLESEALLFHSPIHGLKHWSTVARNGLYLAQHSGADVEVVTYFAFFHDSKRENEGGDPEHGPRAALFLNGIRDLLPLDDLQFQLLKRACSGHTHGTQTDCATLGTCWDADRLDLGRVGIVPDSQYLFTVRAKEIADADDYGMLIKKPPHPPAGC